MEKQKCPEIRFQQFNDTWTETSFGNLSQIRRGASPRPIEDPKWFDKSGIFGWLRIADVTQQNGRIFNIEQKLSVEGQQKTLILEEPHLILSIAATVGKPVINYVPTAIHDGFIVFLNLNADREFIFQWLERFRPNWFKLGQPGSQLNLNSELVKNQGIFLSPLMEEQTQIGNFFQNLDQFITLQEKKLGQTQNLKKAMLEKMFPKAGSTQPEIRLKGGSGDWLGLRIFDLAQNGKLNNGVFNDQSKVGRGYKLINVLDMYLETSIDESKLTLLDLDRKEFEQNRVKYGDIFFTRSSLVKEGIAFSNVYLEHGKDITYDGHLIKLSPNLEIVDPIFLNYCLKSSKVRTQLILGGKSTTMTTIGQQEVGETIVELPNIGEQLKIGQFFKQLDETIALQQQQLQSLKNLKQAFLEKMFV